MKAPESCSVETRTRRAGGLEADRETEVLVVGAGPVGLFAALLLAERGVRVRIIDEERRPAARSYALALHGSTLALLDELGLATDLVGLGHRLEGLAFYDGEERRARVSFAKLHERFPFVLVLPQQGLEGVLAGRLRESGVEVEWNHRLAKLNLAASDLAAGIERLGRGAEGTVHIEQKSWCYPDWVIGADGARSVVRTALGVEFAEIAPPETWAIFEISADLPAENEARVVVDDEAEGVLWPIARGRFRWSFRLDDWEGFVEPREKSRLFLRLSDEPFPYLIEAKLTDLLARRAPWFEASIGRIVWSAATRFERRLASRFGRGRVWLAGDAAHLTGPVGAQSMNVGLREAHDLAVRIGSIAGRDGRGGHTGAAGEALLDSYARERQREWQRLLGAHGPLIVRDDARPWVGERAARLLPCLPASGEDLAGLLRQLGLEIPA